MALEFCAAASLVCLLAWMVVSGLDDLFIDLVFFCNGRKRFPWPEEEELARAAQRRIAILVPLWREHDVIQQMLEHNLAVIRYVNYDFFVGVYPNDPETIRAVRTAARADSRVHVALGRHAGPTSKADCLNSAYRAMEEYEARYRVRFDIVMTHDAEDLIHPESLRLVNWFSREYSMIQMPVLPLGTVNGEWTHGLYCDEFAEYQFKDIPVRQHLGGFLPGNGVGTGFARNALEQLREQNRASVFDPECLTEDYETGFRMHAAGFRQLFLPIHLNHTGPVATREYFPRSWRSAIRQRSRWVAGIALQGWERYGWRTPRRQWYWLWRDRKGLVGNLLSAFTNLLLLAWLVRAAWGGPGGAWPLPAALALWIPRVCLVTAGMALVQTAVRITLSARIYGAAFAAAAPLRILWGNAVNGAATMEAMRLYVTAHLRRHSVAWRKTEHVYPGDPLLIHSRPRLGEILVSLHCISLRELDDALAARPPGLHLGEYLIQLKKITEVDLHQALSSQAGVPLTPLAAPARAHAVHRNFGLDST